MIESVLHTADHAMCGIAVYKAGEALTKRGRAWWLALAGVAFLRAHLHHHANPK